MSERVNEYVKLTGTWSEHMNDYVKRTGTGSEQMNEYMMLTGTGPQPTQSPLDRLQQLLPWWLPCLLCLHILCQPEGGCRKATSVMPPENTKTHCRQAPTLVYHETLACLNRHRHLLIYNYIVSFAWPKPFVHLCMYQC